MEGFFYSWLFFHPLFPRNEGICCFLVGGMCASFSPVEQIMGSDKPRAYKYSFLQGCESGHAKAGNSSYEFFLNKKRYKKDSQYWLGWRKGYKICRNQYDPEGRK